MLKRTKFLASVLIIAILMSMITIPAMAANFFFEEDFENFTNTTSVTTETDAN